MKKNLLLIIFLSLLSSSLFAGKLYIKVAALTHSDTLFSLQYQLREMGYKTYITHNEELYRVYTGPFKDKHEAQIALAKVQQKISRDAYVTSLEVAQGKIAGTPVTHQAIVVEHKVTNQAKIQDEVQTQEPLQISPKEQTKTPEPAKDISHVKSEHTFYVGGSIGATKFDVARSGNLALDVALKTYGPSYGIEGGYYISPNIFVSLNYQKTELRNCDFDAIFATLNYQLDSIGTLSPYVGVVGGLSQLNWNRNPVNGSSAELELNSPLFGAQIGGDIVIYGGLSTFMYYRYMSMDFSTTLVSGALRSEVEHNSQQDFNLGLKYKF